MIRRTPNRHCIWLCYALLVLAACTHNEPAVQPKDDSLNARKSTAEERAASAQSSDKSAETTPPRQWPELPTDFSELEEEFGTKAASYAHGRTEYAKLRIRLSHGLPTTFRKVSKALHGARQEGSLGDELERFYALLLKESSAPALCRHLHSEISATPQPAIRHILMQGLVECHGTETFRILKKYAPSAKTLLEWYASAPGFSHLPVHPRLKRAAIELLDRDFDENRSLVMQGLVSTKSPEGVTLIESVLAEISEGPKRASIAAEIGLHPNPRLFRLYLDGCRHPAMESEYLCDRASESTGSNIVAFAIRYHGARLVRPFLHHRPAEKRQSLLALENCAVATAQSKRYRAAKCLKSLAVLDWSRAANVARHLADPDERPSWSRLYSRQVQALRTFDHREAMLAWAKQRDLLPDGFRIQWAIASGRFSHPDEVTTLLDLLRVGGRTREIGVETGTFPNHHDILLTRLAHLADGLLSDVTFRETPPPSFGDESEPYRLEAFVGEDVLEERAQNRGDWLDVTAVLTLINRVAEHTSRQLRYSVTYGDVQTAGIVVGPPAGIREARQEGLL